MNIKKMITALVARTGQDRGAAALLKACAAPSMAYRAFPLLAPYININSDRQLAVAQVIAPAVVQNGHTDDAGNLGRVLCQIRRDHENWAEMTMQRIMGTTFDNRCRLVGHVLRMAASSGVPVDLDQLGRDLFYYNERTGRKWAAAFWNANDEAPNRTDA